MAEPLHVRVVNLRTGRVLADRARLANSAWDRMVGLLGSDDAGGGLVLEPCSSVHTAFMRYPIDAIFVAADQTVVERYCPLPPWRMTRWVRGAVRVVELAAGRAGDTERGDRLETSPCAS